MVPREKKPGNQYLATILTYILVGGIISFLTLTFHIELTSLFYTLPNISGWDGAAHTAIFDIYSKTIFPSTWGWIPNWQSGMPFPTLYPPLMYLIGGLLTKITGSAVIAYKLIASLILLFTSIAIFAMLKKLNNEQYISLKSFKTVSNKNNISYIVILCIAVAIIMGINTGTPGPKSLFFNSMIGQSLSIIFCIPALLSLSSRSKFFAVIGGISWMLVYLSNIHTALCAITLSFFIIIFQNRKDVFYFIKRGFLIHLTGILGAAFWIIPMLGSYSLFSGSIQPSTYDILVLIKAAWPHMLIALAGLYISFRHSADTNKTLFRWILALFSTVFFVGTLYAFQVLLGIKIPLPIYFHRWFETFFFFSVIPYSIALIYIYEKGLLFSLEPIAQKVSKNKITPRGQFHIKGVYIIVFIFIFTLTPYVMSAKWTSAIYKTYEQDGAKELAESLATSSSVTMVQSRPFANGYEAKPNAIDADIGQLGGRTTFSNLRESSVNGSFLRIARNAITHSGESWSLISFFNPQATSAVINPDKQEPLFRHLGISNIVFFNDPFPNEFESIEFGKKSPYKLSTSTPGFTIASIKDPRSFGSVYLGDIALFIGEDGFRERSINDANYTRFEEMVFEQGLFDKFLTVNTRNTSFKELTMLYQKSALTIITSYDRYSAKEFELYIDTAIENFDTHSHTVFIYDDGSETFRELRAKYIRSPKVVIFNAKNPAFPFDSIVKRLKAVAPNTGVELPLQITHQENRMVSFEIPSAYRPIAERLMTKFDITSPWIFIRQSYHPSWIASVNDIKVHTYLGSPAHTLIPIDTADLYNAGTVSLVFETPSTVTIGHIISLLTFISIAGYAIIERKTLLKKDRK